MSVYSNVTAQDLINLRKLAEQQKEQRALIIKNKILKQTHDNKLAESLSPISKKLDEVNESTKKIGEVFKESISENENNQEIVPVEINSEDSEDENMQNKIGIKALPNSFKFSDLMKNTIGKLISSKMSLRVDQDKRTGGASINGIPVLIFGSDSLKIKDNVYEITPEVHKALSSTGYTGESMKSENGILMMNNILRDDNYTGMGDRTSKQKTFLTITLPKLVEEIQNKTFKEIDLEGHGLKVINPSHIIDIYTRLENLLGIKLSGHTDTLTEASNLIDELYKRGEIQNKQQYRNAINKFPTH